MYNKETDFIMFMLTLKLKNLTEIVSFHRLILEREGPRSLFRGLGPNLVGVAPSRYWLYSQRLSLLKFQH